MIFKTIKPVLKFLFVFIVCFVFVPKSLTAQGDLMVYPKRIVFEGVKRTEQLSLSNTGNDTARYVISVINIRMTEDGAFETIAQPDSAQYFADRYFRFFPRNVVLAPHEAQAVKIQLINTNSIKAGEYRSHIYLRAQAEAKPLGEENTKKDSSITVSIIPIFGISIPVILRVGELSMDINLANVSFLLEKDTIPVLKMDLVRNGNISFYGDIAVDYLSNKGKKTRLATATGMALYTPNTIRHFSIELDKHLGVNFHEGALIIVCTDQASKGIKPAQQQFKLQ